MRVFHSTARNLLNPSLSLKRVNKEALGTRLQELAGDCALPSFLKWREYIKLRRG